MPQRLSGPASNLSGNLSQVKMEVNDRIVKNLFDGHELAEIEIPSSWIIHAAIPLILLDRIDLL
jgi:hypothetical protein